MLTIATFRVMLPEFGTGTTDERIQMALDAAAAQIDPDTFDDLTNHAHGMLAAHILTRGPRGRESAAQKTDFRESSYGLEFQRLTALVGGGFGAT